MKTSTLKSQSGFSLVELMVVVAIIGILAAMSVGQVQKQIAKARQAEAKSNLAAYYTAQTAFRSEYNTFCADFGVIRLELSGRLRYRTGLSADGGKTFADAQTFGYPATGANNGFISTDNAAGLCSTAICDESPEAIAENVAISAVAQTTFRAFAASDIYQAGTADQWSIDNNKTVTQDADGIP